VAGPLAIYACNLTRYGGKQFIFNLISSPYSLTKSGRGENLAGEDGPRLRSP
jgi:hypothetical protein